MAHGKTLELREITLSDPQPLLAEEGKTYYDTSGVKLAVGEAVIHTSKNRAGRRHYLDENGATHNIVNPQRHSRMWWRRINILKAVKAETRKHGVPDGA